MITKTYEFSIATNRIGSKVTDKVEIEFTEEEWNNESKREDVIQEWYNEWVWNNIDGGWEEVE